MKTHKIFFYILILISINAFAQDKERKNRNFFGTFHQENQNINGISIGLASMNDDTSNVHTNGLKLELIGLGILSFMIPKSPIEKDEAHFKELMLTTNVEKVNGIAISGTGTFCGCDINGLNLGISSHIIRKSNGISIAGHFNFIQKSNGIQIAGYNENFKTNGIQLGLLNLSNKINGTQIGFFRNESNDTTGIQIGLWNASKKLKGIQIGLWNVNQKRKFPLVNWGW